jgi:hypothetical protein
MKVEGGSRMQHDLRRNNFLPIIFYRFFVPRLSVTDLLTGYVIGFFAAS